MTSGGHYVSKIPLQTRNSCISFIPAFLLLPSSYVDFENFCSWTRRSSRGLVPWGWPVQGLSSGASAEGLRLPDRPCSALDRVLATRSFPCPTPVATSRWRCEQVRLPRCDLHKPLKALNIYPQNSIKLFIKSNAWNLGSP